jgi:TetR/AcrR family transcriptional regulator
MTRIDLRRRQRSDAILASAVAAFGRHGYHGTSMREIADALELTKGSLYHYFENKAEILYAAHDRSLERMQRALERIEASEPDPAVQLRELVVEHVRAMVDGFHGTALALELDALPERERRRIVARRDRYEHGLRRIIERGVASRRLHPVDPRLAGFAILGAVNWIARWYRPSGPADAEAIGRAFADLFLSGLRTSSRTPNRTPTRANGNRPGRRAGAPARPRHRGE